MSKGLVIVYTGKGKGKTTAALGMALRAIGYDHKVCMIQFIKGSWHYGEMTSSKRLEPEFELTAVTGRRRGDGIRRSPPGRGRRWRHPTPGWALGTRTACARAPACRWPSGFS